MKTTQSQVAEKSAVRVTRDSAEVRMGAMSPSFPPARQRPQVSKDYEQG